MAVFHVEGSESYFDETLLAHLKENKNDEIQKIFENYRPSLPTLKISRLKDSSGTTLLHYAAEFGNHFMVKFLIDSSSKIDAQDDFGRTPLMFAVMWNRNDVIRILLKANADIHKTNHLGDSGLRMILERNTTQPNMINILLEEVSLDKILKSNSLRAPSSENIEPLKALLIHENAYESINDGTLLHSAIKWQMWESAKVLIECGSDVDALDFWNVTPLRYLYNRKTEQTPQILEMLKLLASRATVLTIFAKDRRMQIYKILQYGNVESIDIIMRSNIDLNVIDGLRNTAMHYLALNMNPGIFSKLRGRIFDANMRNKDGYIPLHYAVSKKSYEAVKYFLEHGANVNEAGNRFARSPLYFSYDYERKYDKEIVELLLRYGADPQTCATNANRDFIWTIFDLTMETGSAYGFKEHITRVEPVLARLAIVEALGTEINVTTQRSIRRQSTWMNYLNACRREIERIKESVVYAGVTVLQFLAKLEKKMLLYVRNEEFGNEIERIIGSFEENSPYPDLLRIRLAEATRLVELEENANAVLGRLFGSENNVHYFVAQFIIGYLSYLDIENFCSAFDA